MDITPIKTHRDYRRILKEIEGLMTAKRNTPGAIGLMCSSPWWKPGSGSIIRLISPTRWKRSSTTWTKMGYSHVISSPSSAAEIACTRYSIADGHLRSR